MSTKWSSADDLGRWAQARRPLVVDRITRDDLVPSTYSRARGLSRWPDRNVPDGLVRTAEGIGTIGPKTNVTRMQKQTYALRMELGQRAYDICQGIVAEGPKAKVVGRTRKTGKQARLNVLRLLLDEQEAAKGPKSSGLVVLGSDMAKALGIKPIGNIE